MSVSVDPILRRSIVEKVLDVVEQLGPELDRGRLTHLGSMMLPGVLGSSWSRAIDRDLQAALPNYRRGRRHLVCAGYFADRVRVLEKVLLESGEVKIQGVVVSKSKARELIEYSGRKLDDAIERALGGPE